MDLLAESNGPATSLRVLSLFDTEFNDSFKPKDIVLKKVEQYKRQSSSNVVLEGDEMFEPQKVDVYDLKISFKNASAKDTILKEMKNLTFMYTIELLPPTSKTSVIPVTCEDEEKKRNIAPIDLAEKGDNDITNGMPLKEKEGANCKDHLIEALDVSKEYQIRVNTILNGKPVASITESFGPLKLKED